MISNNVLYPLPINKKQIKWKNSYLMQGGAQLIEVLEKGISYEQILLDFQRFQLTLKQVELLTSWVESNTVIERTAKKMGIKQSYLVQKMLFLNGGGILEKLIPHLSLVPMITEQGEVVSRYSFLTYGEPYAEKDILMVQCICQEEEWCSEMSASSKKRLNKLLILQKNKGQWEELPFADYNLQKMIGDFHKKPRLSG